MLIFTDYRNILRAELGRRQSQNPSYSQAAFARDLGLKPSQLNEVLHNKRGLSLASAKKVAGHLNYETKQTEIFCNQVLFQDGRSKREKQRAFGRLQILKERGKVFQPEFYEMISDGIHYAILELMSLRDFQHCPEWMAKKLGVERARVEKALGLLIRVNQVKKDEDQYFIVDKFTIGPDEISSQSIKNHHKLNLHKAIRAIDEQTLEERDYNSVTLSVQKSMIIEAKKEIRNFLSQFTQRYGDQSLEKDEVYNISVQLFKLTKE